MKPTKRRACAFTLAFTLLSACGAGAQRLTSTPAAEDIGQPPTQPTQAGGPVAQHGALAVRGGQLVDESGAAVQLRGVSSHGLQWYPQFMNRSALGGLRDSWGLSVVRAAMYVEEGGYLQNRAVKDRVFQTVEAAVAAGVYVIVDWHMLSEQDPMVHLSEAKAFFAEVAAKYKGVANVLFEICNEPNGYATWDGDVHTYAEAVAGVIRAVNDKAIIIVGSPQWSQHPDEALHSPVKFDNIMYTIHFYSGTHKQDIRDNMLRAVDGGLAVFATEWSTSEASGDGGPYEDEANVWLKVLKDRQISWTSWSLSDKSETSALLRPGARADGAWTDADLTPAGRFVRAKMRE